MDVELGKYYDDKHSKYRGIAMAITEYLYGCKRIALHSEELDEKGKPTEWEWFDVQHLIESDEDPGGPGRPEAPSR